MANKKTVSASGRSQVDKHMLLGPTGRSGGLWTSPLLLRNDDIIAIRGPFKIIIHWISVFECQTQIAVVYMVYMPWVRTVHGVRRSCVQTDSMSFAFSVV